LVSSCRAPPLPAAPPLPYTTLFRSTVVLVPGSCSTGAAWRPVIAAWKGDFRTVTTSLSGYGGTAARRTAQDASIKHEADVLEARSEEHTSELQSRGHLVCRLLLEKK